jgi:hypothetical protein
MFSAKKGRIYIKLSAKKGGFISCFPLKKGRIYIISAPGNKTIRFKMTIIQIKLLSRIGQND